MLKKKGIAVIVIRTFTVAILFVSSSICSFTAGSSQRYVMQFPAHNNVPLDVAHSTSRASSQHILYNVSFMEDGLPFGTNWSISIYDNGTGTLLTNNCSTTAVISFLLPNATYGYYKYIVTPIPGYVMSRGSYAESIFGVYGWCYGCFIGIDFQPAPSPSFSTSPLTLFLIILLVLVAEFAVLFSKGTRRK